MPIKGVALDRTSFIILADNQQTNSKWQLFIGFDETLVAHLLVVQHGFALLDRPPPTNTHYNYT